MTPLHSAFPDQRLSAVPRFSPRSPTRSTFRFTRVPEGILARMHELSDCEFRLLCAIARCTLGVPSVSPSAAQPSPQPSPGEESASVGLCASLAQLQNLTGRTPSALSGAIASLIEAGWLLVCDDKGRPCHDASVRRALRAPLVYRLSPLCFDVHQPKDEQVSDRFEDNHQPQKAIVQAPRAYVTIEKKQSPPEKNHSPEREENSLSSREDSGGESSLEKKETQEEKSCARQLDAAVSFDVAFPLDATVLARASAFEARFAAQWQQRFPGQAMPPVTEVDRRALYELWERWPRVAPPAMPLEALLSLFFETQSEPAAGFIARHGFSLDAFVHSVFVLLFGQRRHGRGRTWL